MRGYISLGKIRGLGIIILIFKVSVKLIFK